MSTLKDGLNGSSNEGLPLIVAWLAGWVGIILADAIVPMAGLTKWGGAIVAVVTVFLLGLHYYTRRERLNIDRASDALYYLGLLLTLGSLIWSLASPTILGESEHDLSARVNEIIGNFGIALVSTVAGIVGRVSLQSLAGQSERAPVENLQGLAGQIGRTPAEKQIQGHVVEVDHELNLMAQHLRQQMRAAADAFSAFNRETMQEAVATRSAALRRSKEVNKRLEDMVQATIRNMDKAHQEMADRTRQTSEALERQIEEMGNAINTMIMQLQGMTQATIRNVEKTHQEMIDRTQRTSEALERQAKATNEMVDVILNQATVTMEKMEEMTTHFEHERISLEGFGDTIRKEVGAATRILSVLPESVARTNSAVDGLRDTVIRAGETLGRMAEETRHGHEAFRKDTDGRKKELIREIEQNWRNMDREIQAWTNHAEHISKVLKAASEGSESLEQIVKRMRATHELLATLTETVNAAQTGVSALGQAAETAARKIEERNPGEPGMLGRLLGRR